MTKELISRPDRTDGKAILGSDNTTMLNNLEKIALSDLDKDKIKSVLSFLEMLEDDDDVQHVYANLEIDSNFSEKILT